jgi:hypothetical protein
VIRPHPIRTHVNLAHLVAAFKGSPGEGAGACKSEDEVKLTTGGEVTAGVEDEATLGVEVDDPRVEPPGPRPNGICFGKAFSTSWS